MIRAISPKPPTAVATTADVSSGACESKEALGEETETDWITPAPTGLEKSDAYLQTPDAEEGCNKPTWAAHRLWLRILFGKDGDLRGLKDLAENYPNSSQVQNYLARAYEEYENYFDAAKTFENAAALSGVPEEKAKLLGDAAVQYIKAGFQVDADETLKKL